MGTLAEQLKRIVGPPGRRRALVAVVVALVAGLSLVAGGTSLAADESTSLARQQGGRTIAADDGTYKAEVSFGEAAGLPEGVTLEIVTLDEDSDEYAAAREAVTEAEHAADESFDEETLGMAALDIALRDAKGREVEPKGAVSVRLEMRDLPDEVAGQDIDVRHITAEDGVAEFVQQDVSTTDGTATAEFSVEGFSVFTITWTRDTSSAQRVGAVRLHTVNESGTEITDPDTYTTSELTKISGESGILTIADWIKTKNPTGFAYVEARLGSVDGTVITGLKVRETRTTSGGSTTTSYQLQYTSDATVNSSSAWHDVSATISDKQVNNADIYLVFSSMIRPVNLHFMTLTGEAITDDAGNAIVKTIDAAVHTSEYDLTSYVTDNAPEGYSFDTTQMNTGTTSRCQMILSDSSGKQRLGSSVQGSYYRYLKYENGQVQMARGDKVWHTVTSSSVDVYVTFIHTGSTTRTFTVHYVDEHKKALDGQDDRTFTLDSSNGVAEQALSSGDLVPSISDKDFVGSYLGSESDSLTQNQGYVTTDYPHVTSVRLAEDGTASFLMAISGNPFTLSTTRSNRWSYTTAGGRTFTLRRVVTGSGDNQSIRFSLVDDQVSTTAIDLSLSGVSDSTETYVGSCESENTSIVYTVTATTSGGTTSYSLDVSQWMQNDLTDIYQVYASSGNAEYLTNPSIEVKNDLVYSGHLVVEMNTALQNALENADEYGITNIKYTWYKIVNDTSDDATGTEVARTLTDGSYNVGEDASKRTWLDLAADDGALGTGKTSVRYYCVLSYDYDGQTRTATSDKLSMINYDSLWNGGFETPTMTTNQVSNSWYYSENGGVWRTTGLGSGRMLNRDIEIVNTTWASYWKNSYNWNPSLPFAAREGNQFAELNCETAGALYQDVVTLPYENLSYWLSHRARGRVRDSTPEYDTMYLVIMPTKLAMTSGASGGELKEQTELESYISSHGGFTSDLATSEESVVTYRDNDSGVLIMRISSSDQSWHDVSVANGYTAMAGLTRFFFVAGPTASGSNTVGNFLDNVGFSQQLPTPDTDEFQVEVTKTFSNLEMTDIAKLADAFALTIRGYDSESTAASDNDHANSNGDLALDNTRLTFSVSGDNQITLHAVRGATDLFASGNGSAGTVTTNDDAGTVTMTWTLLANSVSGTKYYRVDETGEDLGGYTVTPTQTGTVTQTGRTDETPIPSSHVATVTGGSVMRMSFTNSYNQDSQITVQKVFSGITPTTVQELASSSNPYTVTVTKAASDGKAAATLRLVYNEQRPYSDGSLPEGVDNVTVSFRQGTGGVSILTWTITGWDAGSYTVTETGYHPQGEASQYNTLAKTTINGVSVTEQPEGGTAAEVSIVHGVTIGGESSDVPTVKAPDGSVVEVREDGTATLTDSETNLLIVQYQQSGSSTTMGYLVWTPQTAGANLRQAILNYIKGKFGDTTAELSDLHFYSSENPGVMQVNEASVTYDADTRRLTFHNSTDTIWQYYFGTTYTLERTTTVDGKETTEVVASDEPEIRIRNDYNPIIKIQKIEEGHNDLLLGGASFQIYQESGESRQYYLDTSTVSLAQFGTPTDDNPAETFTTASGTGTVNVGVLPEGTYCLQETHAPDGYNTIEDIQFHVSAEGVVTLGDGTTSTSRTDNAEVTLTDPYYTITVSDPPGARLPEAGGSGGVAMSLAYLAGLVVVTLASGGAVMLGGRGGGRESS